MSLLWQLRLGTECARAVWKAPASRVILHERCSIIISQRESQLIIKAWPSGDKTKVLDFSLVSEDVQLRIWLTGAWLKLTMPCWEGHPPPYWGIIDCIINGL